MLSHNSSQNSDSRWNNWIEFFQMAACGCGAALCCYPHKVHRGWSARYTAVCYCRLICNQVCSRNGWMHEKREASITFSLRLCARFSSQGILSARSRSKIACHKPDEFRVREMLVVIFQCVLRLNQNILWGTGPSIWLGDRNVTRASKVCAIAFEVSAEGRQRESLRKGYYRIIIVQSVNCCIMQESKLWFFQLSVCLNFQRYRCCLLT